MSNPFSFVFSGPGGSGGATQGPPAVFTMACPTPAVAANAPLANFLLGMLPVGIRHTLSAVYFIPSADVTAGATNFPSINIVRPNLDGTTAYQPVQHDVTVGLTKNVAKSLNLDAEQAMYDPGAMNGVMGTSFYLDVAQSAAGKILPAGVIVFEYFLRP